MRLPRKIKAVKVKMSLLKKTYLSRKRILVFIKNEKSLNIKTVLVMKKKKSIKPI